MTTHPDFPDTMAIERYNKPMDFKPARYREAMENIAACTACNGNCPTPSACRLAAEDSDFGALEGVARGFPYIVTAWAVIAAFAAAVYIIWW